MILLLTVMIFLCILWSRYYSQYNRYSASRYWYAFDRLIKEKNFKFLSLTIDVIDLPPSSETMERPPILLLGPGKIFVFLESLSAYQVFLCVLVSKVSHGARKRSLKNSSWVMHLYIIHGKFILESHGGGGAATLGCATRKGKIYLRYNTRDVPSRSLRAHSPSEKHS